MSSFDLVQGRAADEGDDRAPAAPHATRAGVMDPGGLPAREETSLVVHYLSILRRRRWIIAGAVLLGLLVSVIVTLLMTPVYTATTTIEVQREQRNFTMVQGAEPDNGSIDYEFYETQYGLLRARSLAQRVARDLRLANDPAFFEMYRVRQAADWFENGRVRRDAPALDKRVAAAGDILLANLAVSPVRLSRLVELQFTAPRADFARKVIDAWASRFIALTLERRYEASSYARLFLEQRLTQLRRRIDQSERRVVDYAAREGIVNLPAAAGANGQPTERSLAADDLATLNTELAKATADRVQAESRVGTDGGTVIEGLENNAITQLRARRAELAADLSKMLQQFEPGYPPAQALQAQIAQLDRSLAREEGRVRSTLAQTYQASAQRERTLSDRVAQLKSGVLDLRRRSIQYNIYQRDADTNRQLYDALLQRYKEIGVAGGVGVNNISIVDNAELPAKPSSPRPLINLAIGLLAGMALGVLAAILLEQIDEGLADPSEVPNRIGLPLLGTIPRTLTDPLESLNDRKSALSEAYLSLQTNLAFSTDHGVPKTLAVTSSRPAEGKTTTSVALAKSLGRVGHRVLLIDADMRSPSIHHMFAMGNATGLSNYLSGNDGIHDLIQHTEDGLSVLVAGPQPPNAAELLAGPRLAELLAHLREQFDQIVVDAPPVMGLADAPLIANVVEGTVMVIEFHQTKRSVARVAFSRLNGIGAHVLGAVVTKFDPKKAQYGYGYNYGYGYGYGATADTK
jgi:succinoglycan biosynthesis transport protein ExoP